MRQFIHFSCMFLLFFEGTEIGLLHIFFYDLKHLKILQFLEINIATTSRLKRIAHFGLDKEIVRKSLNIMPV